MHLYSKEYFERDLKKVYKLSPTDETVDDARLWKIETGCYITITQLPEGQVYPDYYLDIIVEHLSLLGLHYH